MVWHSTVMVPRFGGYLLVRSVERERCLDDENEAGVRSRVQVGSFLAGFMESGPHSALRPAGQRQPQGPMSPAPVNSSPQSSAGPRRRWSAGRDRGRAAGASSMPVLWRPHACDRDLRSGLHAALPPHLRIHGRQLMTPPVPTHDGERPGRPSRSTLWTTSTPRVPERHPAPRGGPWWTLDQAPGPTASHRASQRFPRSRRLASQTPLLSRP